jgi:hypothetical protein
MAYLGSTAAILSNYDEALKTFYLPAIREQLNHDTPLSDMIDTNEEDVSGKNATINCHYGRTTGTGSRADGGALPEADYQKFKTAVVPMKYHYGRVTFSGPTIAATRDERGSYARVIDTEISGVVRDLQKEINRQLWGCGYGILARWASGASTTITVPKLYRGNAASTSGDGFGTTFGAKYFEENTSGVAVIMTASGSVMTVMTVGSSNMVVSAIDSTTSTTVDSLTITTDQGSPATGTFFVRPASLVTANASSTAGAWRLEMMGLRGIVDNVNLDDIACFDSGSNAAFTVEDPLQGLDTDSYNWWKSTVDTGTSTRYATQRALTLNDMQKMFDKVETKAGKGYGPDSIWTSKPIRREYLTIMQADRRNVNTMTLDGGWKALEFNGIPLLVDDDAIDGEMYFLTLRDLQIYRMSDYDWMTKDGAVLSRITGYDAYEAVLFRYAELGTSRRNSHGVLADLAYEV